MALAALGLAAIGQYYFSFVRSNLLDGSVFFAVAIVVYLALIRRHEAPSASATSLLRALAARALDRIRDEPIKTVLVTLSFGLAYTTIRVLAAKPGTGSYWDVFFLWVLSFVVYALAFVRFPSLDLGAWLRTNRGEVITVASLTAAAAILRFAGLGSMPDIISGDEGLIGTLAVRVVKGELNNMLATVYGHSTLYLFILGGFVKMLGTTPLALRLASAISGTLTVPVLYFLARRMFNARVALVAASLLTVSHFHLHFSRVIVNTGIQDALFATLAFYFLYAGLEERSASRLALGGLIIGFELYIYMGARLIILLIPVYLVALLIVNRKMVVDNISNVLALAGALAVISAPMAEWAVKHPDEFMARANQVGIIQSGWLAQEAARTGISQLRIFLDQLLQASLTINYYPAEGFYYSKLPMLDFVTGALFVLGLAYSLYHVLDARNLLLNGWFWSGVVVAGALVVLPAKGAYRLTVVFPAVCILVALGWDRLISSTTQAIADHPVLAKLPTVLVIALFSVLNLKSYFIDYAQSCLYEGLNTRLASHVGAYMGELGPDYTFYLLTAPRGVYGVYRSIDFLSGELLATDLQEPLSGPPTSIDPRAPAAFFISPEREGELAYLEDYIPGGTIDRVYDCQNLLLTVYVTGQTANP